MLQSLGSQKVRHDMEIEQQQHIQPAPSHAAGPLVKIVKNVSPCVFKVLLPQTPQADTHHLPVKKADPGDLTPEHPSSLSLVSPGPHRLPTLIVHPVFCTGCYI